MLANNLPLLTLITFIFSLIVGSFLNVVIYRLPIILSRDWTRQCADFLNQPDSPLPHPEHTVFNLAKPDSHCPGCSTPIGALDNIPLLSFVMLKGRCRYCSRPISARYPIIEATTALLSTLVVVTFGFTWMSAAVLLLTWALIVLTLIDVDHQLLPDDITLPLLWLGLIVNSFGLFTTLSSALWGAVAGYGILWSIYWLFKLLTGKEGMGYGDFKLLAALGAWMGWQALPQIILLSSLVGAVVGLIMMAFRGHDRNIPIPFGPYLAGAGFIAMLWGDALTAYYQSTFL